MKNPGSTSYRLEFQGVAVATFAEADGLDAPVGQSVESYEVTLRYGSTSSTDFLDWLVTSDEPEPEHRAVTIVRLDEATVELRRWDLFDAWPKQWKADDVDPAVAETEVESITIVYDSIHQT